FVSEGHAFFRELLVKNESILNFLDSDFAMLNSRLAEHYGTGPVSGVELKRVSLPEDSIRGGVLTMGGVLKVTANGTNTSPVERGVFVLENILGKPTPPPPPNIPGIEPDIRGAQTIREQLEKHRESESCRGCHQAIDPPGFALENFDPVGNWRERYLAWVPAKGHEDKGWGSVQPKQEVDSSGIYRGGQPFDSIEEFKAIMLSEKDAFTRCFVTKMMAYATGREMGFSDRAEIDRVSQSVAEKGYGLRTVIDEVVKSEIFNRP
ncbi:MAG: DUF1588 domain-containing protein, partial [Verrucomicrobiota bacterium]